VRVAFAIDSVIARPRAFSPPTSGVNGEDVRDLMIAAVEDRFGPVNLRTTIAVFNEILALRRRL